MNELRYNPFLDTYTIVAAHRQNRPHLPKDYCPFCPSFGQVPHYQDVYLYPNDFPALSLNPQPVQNDHPFFLSKPAYGACEVILYNPNHDLRFSQLSLQNILKILQLWKERFLHYQKDPRIQYIFPFENNGEEVGVTLHHPHGQLYAYSWIPAKILTELHNARNFWLNHNKNLLQELIQHELHAQERMLCQNHYFIAFLPFFTDYPYGVYVADKEVQPHIGLFCEEKLNALAEILKNITQAFDKVFDRPFPYMMCVHQCPVNNEQFADCHRYYGFHIEFYPPLRERDKIKWYASSEMGAGAATNTCLVEQTAYSLRNILQHLD